MSHRLSDEELREFEFILPRLTKVIATGSDIDKSLANISNECNSTKEKRFNEILRRYAQILQEAHDNLDTREDEYVAKLMEFGTHWASAKLAVLHVRGRLPPATTTLEDEIQFEISRRNCVRAVVLAEKRATIPQNEIWRLKELALRQYASDYRNLPGFNKLVQDWEIPRTEVERILRDIWEEQNNYATSEASLQYDIKTMQNITLKEWIENVLNSKW